MEKRRDRHLIRLSISTGIAIQDKLLVRSNKGKGAPTSTLSGQGQELKTTTQATTSPVLVPSQGSQKHTDTMNKTDQAANTDKIDERGDTFWILVYVFMVFAIFEVICVALFLIYRQRKRKRKQRKRDLEEESAEDQGPTTYDNQAMTASTINLPAENIQLYENEVYNEPRYSVVKRLERSQRDEAPILIENGIVASMVSSESSSRRNSRIPRSRSIIVLPKDCVIVHASGSQSRRSRHSEHDGEHSTNNDRDNGINKVGHNSDDNKSLYSWESFSTFYRTSTDEDYGSGGNPAPWEEDSLYEEPDKVLPKGDTNKPPALPAKNFSLNRLFYLQESVITAANNDGDNKGDNGQGNGDNDHNEEEEDEEEHIYESAECVIPRICVSYYENAYDLPEDALANGPDKPNKGSLKHILHERSEEGDSKPSLNLGVEFVNNDEDNVDDDDDVRLRPQRQSMLFLQQGSETKDNTTSVC